MLHSKIYTLEIPLLTIVFLCMYKGLSSDISNDIFVQTGFYGRNIISQDRTIIFKSQDSAYNADFQSVMIFKNVVQNRVMNTKLWYQIDLEVVLACELQVL